MAEFHPVRLDSIISSLLLSKPLPVAPDQSVTLDRGLILNAVNFEANQLIDGEIPHPAAP
jgi:hypothetical protein